MMPDSWNSAFPNSVERVSVRFGHLLGQADPEEFRHWQAPLRSVPSLRYARPLVHGSGED